MKKSIDIKRILYIVFGIMLATSMLLFVSTIGKEKSKAVAETTTNASEITVEVTEAYTFTDSDPATHHASTSPAIASWETVLGMKKFFNTFNTAESKLYVGFNGIDAAKYSYISFRMLIWAAQKENEEVSYIPAEFFTTENVSSCKTDVPYSWKYGDASLFSNVEAFRVFLPTASLKNKNGMVNGFIVKNPLTSDLSGWVMVSDITLANEMPVVLDTAVDKTNLKATNTYGIVQDDFRVAEWRNYGLRNRLKGDGSDTDFVARIGFDRTIYAGAVDYFTFNALGWGKASTPCVIVKNLNGTIASRLTLYYAYDCEGNLSVTIPAKGLADENDGINGFILESPNGVDHFVFSDITAVKDTASHKITSENVTFKLGGAYGDDVFYAVSGEWKDAGWIVNDIASTGDITMQLDVAYEWRLGNHYLGAVRMPDKEHNWASSLSSYNYPAAMRKSARGTFLHVYDGKATVNYTASDKTARINGEAHPNFAGKIADFSSTGAWEYFGIGFGDNGSNPTYALDAKVRIYDADNNDLKVAAETRSAYCNSYSSVLKANDGKTVYFTADNSVVSVTTAGGENVEVTKDDNGIYSFVMPAEDVSVVAEKITEEEIVTSENVTFKLGGNYGESVYYDLQGNWTGVGAGWIVNKTQTTGDVNVYLNINDEKPSGGQSGSIFGLVRLKDTYSEWASGVGFYNYFVNGADNGFSAGTWPNHKVFLNEYDSGTLSARTLVGTNKASVTHDLYTGKANSYAEAKDWTYFGFGWGNRAYEIKTKIQIYDAANNDLGILASEPSRESYSCRLIGKVGERVYFTVKDGAVPVVTADGEAIELTAEADGRYSFVMPAKRISVTAKSNKIALEVQKNGTVVKTEEIAKTAEGFAAAIPEVTEKDVKLVGYEIGGKLYKTTSEAFAAADMSGEKVVVNLIAPRVETEDGAAIRKNGTAGMRFSSVVTLSAHIKKYGMILTVRDNVDNANGGDGVGIENFTKEGLSAVTYKYLEIANTDEGFKSYSKSGNEMFSIVLTAIKDDHRELEYIARTYVVVEYDNGNSETYYSDVDFENNARSAHEVAASVLESEKDKLSAEQKEFIESNYLSLNVLSLTAYYGPVSGAYMVNGEVVSNNGGGVYDIATVSDVKAFFDAGFDFIMGDDADYMTYRSIGHSVGDGYVDPDGNADLAYYPNSDAARLLNLVKDYCDEYGVPYKKARVLVKLGYLEGAMGGENGHTDGMIQINLTRVYGYLKEYPCFGGFILRDEPRGYMSETYNKWYKWLVDDLGVYRDGYMLYGALLGMNAAPVNVEGSSDDDTTNYSGKAGLTAEQYETYLNKYIAGLSGVGQEGLSFDYYPFTETINRSLFGSHSTSYEMKKQYYQNLEIFAKLSETKGSKRTMCLQSVAFYNKKSYNKINGSGTKSSYTYYGAVSEQMMTYQLYAALAYGYNGVAYFTYTQPSNQTDAEWFSNAAYMWEKQADGSFKAVKTATYDYIKNANAEAMAMSRKIVGYKWLGTTYSVGTSATCGIFGGTTSYNGGVLTSVASSYDSYAGCMKNGNGEYGFMVVNADDPRNGRSNSVTLSFADGYTSVSYVENGETKTAALTNGKITLNIGAGKGIFVVPHKG